MIGLLLRGALRAPTRVLPILAALAALAGVAALSRSDSAIAGLPAAVLLPLAAAAAQRAAATDTRRAVDALVDRGLEPRRAVATHWALSAVLIGSTLTLGTLGFLALAHHPSDHALWHELLVTLPVVFAATLAYASYYGFAGTFGRGQGLTFAVLLDLVVGPVVGLGWVLPLGHTSELLGAGTRSLSGPTHFAWLYALCILYGALTLWRTRLSAPVVVVQP